MASTQIDSLRHKDKRTNIPTEELRDFMPEEEASSRTMLYPRDPSLDPQLVWKGKDDLDRESQAVEVMPIYIQEKIHPQALIEDLRAQGATGASAQPNLFSDFNGIPFEEMVEFYKHKQNWTNRLILGDSERVMVSLAEKEGLKGKVQMIYFDPPYGIKFGSNWQVSTRKRAVIDGRAADITRQPEQIRAFRDTWKHGIHSFLPYLRDRLRVAHELLTPTGSIFVQIGNDNVHLVRCVLDEIFGPECHVVTLLIKKKGNQKSNLIDPVNDYLLWYSKTPRSENGGTGIKFRPLLEKRELDRETLSEFGRVELPDGREFPIKGVPDPSGKVRDYRLSPKKLFKDHAGARLFRSNPLTSGGERRNQSLPFKFRGRVFGPGAGNSWKHTARSDDGGATGLDRLAHAGRLIVGKNQLRFKSYLDDLGYKPISNWWDGLGGASNPIYVVQTNTEIVKRCILMTTDPGDLVLDPTCGSGTTPYVAEQWGRRWIAIVIFPVWSGHLDNPA